MALLRIKTIFVAFTVLFVGFSLGANAAPEAGKQAPHFIGVDSNGHILKLADFTGIPLVLEWTNHQCPYVRKHYQSGNMQRLQRKLTDAGAKWVSIISSAPGQQGFISGDEANLLSATRGAYANHVILDPSGEIGRAYGAKATPHMVLIDEKGVVRYIGAIDDKPSSRISSLDGAHNYLAAAWESYEAGQQIKVPVTKAYGCTVKYAQVE